VGIIAGLAAFCCFIVPAGEYAVITAFGNPVKVIKTPGLQFKYPYQSVNRFDNRLFVHVPALSEFLTLEKTPVIASSAILWRIAEPQQFLQTVFNRLGAESRLSDILFAELGAAIGNAPLSTFFSTEPGTYQAETLIAVVAAQCRTTARRDYGIDIVDIQLQRLDFPERNRLSVFARMKSERVSISMQYRSEGEEQSIKLRAAADQEKTKILAAAYKTAQQTRGEGEAGAARIYAGSLSAAPEFYRFLRGNETFRKAIGKDTTLVLPVDSELFRLLQSSDYYELSKKENPFITHTPQEPTPMPPPQPE
jgi:membrane protease subunit HflC